MKRIITFIILAGVSVSAFGANQSEVAPVVKAFYATDTWNKAFMGYYGVNPGVAPPVPEDQDEREALGTIREMLQSGTESDVQMAVNTLGALIQQQGREKKPTSAMILQIAGTLEMQLASLTSDNTQRKLHQTRAESYFKTAVDPNTGFPNFLNAHKNLANLIFKTGREKEAKEHFVKAVELGDRDAVTFGLLGAIYMNESKFISSETALRNSMMINPNIQEFKQLLGNVLLAQERYQEANAIFAELLQKKPGEVNFWMAQANCYIAMDDIDEAARILEIIRFMGGANVDSLMLLGDVYINKDMIDEATELYLEAVNSGSDDNKLRNFIRSAETLNNYAAYDQGMQVVQAISRQFAGQLSTENEIDLLALQSEINISLGKGKEAAKNLEELIKRDPFNGRALLSLARYYTDADVDESITDEIERDLIESRNQEQAVIYFERAQELDDDLARLRAFIGEAQLRVQREELDKAADLLEAAQSIQYQDYVQAYLDQIRQALKNKKR